jgi:hypothetical protein
LLRASLRPQSSSLCLPGIISMDHHTWLVLWHWALLTFLIGLASDCNPPISTCDYKHERLFLTLFFSLFLQGI